MMLATVKYCVKCSRTLPVSAFTKHKHRKDGLTWSCRECEAIYQKAWRAVNRESTYINEKVWHNAHREQAHATETAWRKTHILERRASVAKRRAQKLRATLPGFEAEIKEIYRNCPVGYHVDHIWPLQGKTSRGLHVPWNLQYLPAIENLSKGNKEPI